MENARSFACLPVATTESRIDNPTAEDAFSPLLQLPRLRDDTIINPMCNRVSVLRRCLPFHLTRPPALKGLVRSFIARPIFAVFTIYLDESRDPMFSARSDEEERLLSRLQRSFPPLVYVCKRVCCTRIVRARARARPGAQ